jgi:FkbM family methyltransferase
MASIDDMLAQALTHHRAGRLNEADLFYRQILTDWPNNPDAVHRFGVLAAQLGHHDAAANLIIRAINLKPTSGDFYASLGNVLYLQGKLREGQEAYKTAMYLAYIKHMPFGFDEILDRAGRSELHRPRPAATAEIADYKSQALQDLFLDRWVFREAEGGQFIDIGAHDGITYSNTWFFENRRKWQGICVEPNPSVFKRLMANRMCTTVNCCVSDKAGSVRFQKISGYSEMLSGIADKYEVQHAQRIRDEMQTHGGSSEIISLPARTFNDIAAEQGLSDVNYVSIDTEGGELEILKSIDFKAVFVHVLSVEFRIPQREAMMAFMRDRNFELIKSMGSDLLFLNRNSPIFPAYHRLRSE